ncbi:transcriptional regulator [Aliidongia dinghuensis]|uniref:Transcriptional regulator n=1 Tax=Aliidongia dinghuensis TaxID=1867774 RepID=A0A8J3E1Y2_9PROT|nr:ROK family protein [Aliidongia dinghuensis]GGF05194.1 transcriptional regulator [Aliidongia dinghuensis]
MPAGRAGQGTNSVQIRQYNQRLVLQRLRRLGQASKADLARAAGLTNSAVGQIVAELEEFGLIEAVGKRHEGQRGQPATLLKINPSGAFGIGVRIDRSRIETVLADLGGRIIAQHTHDLDLPPPDRTLEIVRQDVESLLVLCSPETRRRVTGIGLARPFNLGSWLRLLDLSNVESLRAWDETDFAAALARETSLTVFDENDGTAAAIAELFYGVGHAADDFLYLFIGPCIGGGLALDGDCRRGETDNAGDVAVMPVAPSGLVSAPALAGPTEILLTRASINALIRHLRHHGHGVAGLGDLPGLMARHRDLALEWVEDCARALVGPILAMQALLDVPLVVLDSDLDRAWIDFLIERTDVHLAAAVAESRRPPRLAAGSFGAYAGALGAASLPLFVHFGPRAGLLTGDVSAPLGVREHAFPV